MDLSRGSCKYSFYEGPLRKLTAAVPREQYCISNTAALTGCNNKFEHICHNFSFKYYSHGQ